MTTNDNIKPLVDRILMNPLQFTQVSDSATNNGSGVSSETMKNASYIIIGKGKNQLNQKNKGNKDADGDKNTNDALKETKKTVAPKSMAEALALYTAGSNKSNKNDKKKEFSKKEAVEVKNEEGDSSSSVSSDEVFHETREYALPESSGEDAEEVTDKNEELTNKEDEDESDEDDMDFQEDNDDNDSATSASSGLESESESELESTEFLAGNMDEDIGEDIGEAIGEALASTHKENRTTNEVPVANKDYNMDDDEGDGIDKISDSERIGLLEESIAYEIAKEKKAESSTKKEDTMKSKAEENAEEEEEEELKHKLPSTKREAVPIGPSDLNEFYQFNENFADEGSILPSKIIKNWGTEMSTLKPRGLLNHGVTCYTNAAVQAMLHIPAVQHYLWDIIRGGHSDVIKPTSVTVTLAETSKRMWYPNEKLKKKLSSYINPSKLINRLEDINCMMSEWQQEDSHEYFMSLMSRLQEDSVPRGHKMTESIIYDIFGGLLKQLVTCKSCGGISKTEQPFYDLSLHLKGKKNKMDDSSSPNVSASDLNEKNEDKSNENIANKDTTAASQTNNRDNTPQTVNRRFTIEKSIKDFFSPELIKVDNEQKGYVCEKCHKTTNAVKHNSILRAPETLLVHLKKFRFNGTSSSKMKQAVSYPMFLDMTEYCDTESIPKGKKQLPVKYQLISVVVHEGRSLSSGHYIAHCKQPDGSWATYDDEYINKITEKDVLNETNAYYLLYTRLTPKAIKLQKSLPKQKAIGLPGNNNNNNKAKENDTNSRPSSNGKSNGNGVSLANHNKNRKKWKKNKKAKLNK